MGAPCRYGPRKIVGNKLPIEKLQYICVACPQCSGRMCWLCGVAVPKASEDGKHYCAAIRDELATYDICSNCYEGGYQYGAESVNVRDSVEDKLDCIIDAGNDEH